MLFLSPSEPCREASVPEQQIASHVKARLLYLVAPKIQQNEDNQHLFTVLMYLVGNQ